MFKNLISIAILLGCAAVHAQSIAGAETTKSVVLLPLTDKTSPFACEHPLKYIPLPAFSVSNYSFTKIKADGSAETAVAEWPTGTTRTTEINQLLPNIATEVTVEDVGHAFSAGGIFGATLHKKLITIDFMKYRSEPISSGKDPVIYSRIGAGMRLKIAVVTSEANLSGSISAIVASAKSGKTVGSISADIIGMDSNDMTIAMPFTSDLSDGSIQKVIEALAVVKSKLNDSKTTLSPQFIAKITCPAT
jgi:hypothetical protein